MKTTRADIEVHNDELKVVVVDTGDPEDNGICWVDVYCWDNEYNDWDDEPTSSYSSIEASASDEEKERYAKRILNKLIKANKGLKLEHNLAMAV